MPLYVKEGSIVPTGPALQYTGEKVADPLTLYVFTGKDAAFTLYEDEGTNYHYEQGAYATIPLSYNESTGTLTIGARKGTYKGMPEKRTIQIVWVKKDHAAGVGPDVRPDQAVVYTGSALEVK